MANGTKRARGTTHPRRTCILAKGSRTYGLRRGGHCSHFRRSNRSDLVAFRARNSPDVRVAVAIRHRTNERHHQASIANGLKDMGWDVDTELDEAALEKISTIAAK